MAKNKANKAVKKPVEENIKDDVKLAEIEEKTAKKVGKKVEVDEVQAFINRKLKAINSWSNPAKQRRAIEGLFRNKRGK